MHSIVANADFTYEEMKLADLKQRIVEENNLTTMDILKGFHAKSKAKLEYNIVIPENKKNEVDKIYLKYKEICETLMPKLAQETYNKIYNERVAILKEVYDKEKNIDEPLEEIISNCHKNKSGSVTFSNAFTSFRFALDDVCWMPRHGADIVQDAAINLLTDWVKETYGDDFLVVSPHAHSISHAHHLPIFVELNANIDIDFDNTYQMDEDRIFEGAKLLGSAQIDIPFDNHVLNKYWGHLAKSAFTITTPYIYVKLDSADAHKFFNEAVNKLLNQANEATLLEYAQNLEAQPITINLNSKTGKCELIDGYKRLLFTVNEDFLNIKAPVRVFNDLSDEAFLSLLYAANIWKYQVADKFANSVYFHDRGYLFALKTRFNFELPQTAYSLSNKELKIFEYYDFGCDADFKSDFNHFTFPIKSMYSIFDSGAHKKNLINDITILYNDLYSIALKDHGYDANIASEIEGFIIYALGRLRRGQSSDTQLPLTPALIESIFDDKRIVKACAKKHLTSSTYVQKHFEKTGIFKIIREILIDNLVSK